MGILNFLISDTLARIDFLERVAKMNDKSIEILQAALQNFKLDAQHLERKLSGKVTVRDFTNDIAGLKGQIAEIADDINAVNKDLLKIDQKIKFREE